MPWLQFDEQHLWASFENVVKCYKQNNDGMLHELSRKTLKGHSDDVDHFVSKGNTIVTSARWVLFTCHLFYFFIISLSVFYPQA